MQLRVSTPSGSVLLVKSAGRLTAVGPPAVFEGHRPGRVPHDYLPDAEPGRAYDTISAEVVGIFHAAPDLPEAGASVQADQVLGYIESLKVRTPVKAGIDGRLVGQAVEDGQPVDFGETLFIIDSGPEEPAPEPAPEEPIADMIEPPRI